MINQILNLIENTFGLLTKIELISHNVLVIMKIMSFHRVMKPSNHHHSLITTLLFQSLFLKAQNLPPLRMALLVTVLHLNHLNFQILLVQLVTELSINVFHYCILVYWNSLFLLPLVMRRFMDAAHFLMFLFHQKVKTRKAKLQLAMVHS